MKVRRDIASIPLRSAAETWRAIIELASGDDSVDKDQLKAAGSIMESLIADEAPRSAPIVFKGAGPRLLIYCLYDEDAMEAGLDIDDINFNPTTGDWQMTAPCEDEDVDWMNKSLKSRAPRIRVRAADDPPGDQDDDSSTAAKTLEFNWEALESP